MKRYFRGLSRLGDQIVGGVVIALFALMRRLGPVRAPALCAAVARTVGPLLPVHRVGLANIRAAYPEKDAAWHSATLKAEWDNLGRVAGEYVHLAALWDLDPEHPTQGRIQTSDVA